FDERNLALARASVNALTSLDVLRHLPSAPSPIERLHISSRGDFGAVRLAAHERGLDAFGQVVIARELGVALEARLSQLQHLTRARPARVTAIEQQAQSIRATVEDAEGSRSIDACLLV